MDFKRGERIVCPIVKVENNGVEKREVQELHFHRPPFRTEVVKGHKLPSCMVLNTGHSNRGKNVLHIYYDREQMQPEVTEEILFRSRQLLRVMWVVGILMMLDILIRI